MNLKFLIKKKWLKFFSVSSNYWKQNNTSVFFKIIEIRHTILNWDLLYFYLYLKNQILVLTKKKSDNFVNNKNLLEVLLINTYIFIKLHLKIFNFCKIQKTVLKKTINFFFVKSWKIIFIFILTILVFYFFYNYIYEIPSINNANNLLIYPIFAFFCLQKKEKEIFFNKLAILDRFFLSKYLEYITNFNNDAFNTKFLKRNLLFILKDWIFYMCFIFISIRFLQFYHSFCILSIKKQETKNKKEIFIKFFMYFWMFKWFYNFLNTKYYLYLLWSSNFKEYYNCIKIYGIKFFIFSYLANRLQGISFNYMQIGEEIWFLRNLKKFPFKKLVISEALTNFYFSLFLQFSIFVTSFAFLISSFSIYILMPMVKFVIIYIFDNSLWNEIPNLLFPIFPVNPVIWRAYNNVVTNNGSTTLSTIKYTNPKIRPEVLLNHYMSPVDSEFLGYFPSTDLMATKGVFGLKHSEPYATFTKSSFVFNCFPNLPVNINISNQNTEQQFACLAATLVFNERNLKFLEAKWTQNKYENICNNLNSILEQKKDKINFSIGSFLWKNSENNYTHLYKSQYFNENFPDNLFYPVENYYILRKDIHFFLFENQPFLININNLQVFPMFIKGNIPKNIDLKIAEIVEFKKKNNPYVCFHDLEEIQRVLYNGYTLAELSPNDYTTIVDASSGKNIIVSTKLLVLYQEGYSNTKSGTDFALELSKSNNSIIDQRRNVELGVRAGQINTNNIYSNIRFDQSTGKLTFDDWINN